jgi:23S rRNA pseudouridine1911/1915/1917 synthase
MELRTFTADAPAPRLDRWLVERCPDLTRSRLQALAEQGLLTVNGVVAKSSQQVRVGDVAALSVPAVQALEVTAEDVKLDVLFEDEFMIVVNKPPGLVVHPAPGHNTGTLVNALLHHCAGSLSGIGGVERPGIVHRLDKDTSGVLVVAKSDRAHQKLAKAFHDRTVSKRYLAITARSPRLSSGTIEAAIARHTQERKRMAVAINGRKAVTRYRVLEAFKENALLECDLLTGRTHQIRVHLAHLGCPLLGDKLYGRFGAGAPRQMLHAWKLGLDHPKTGERMEFTAEMSPDFKDVLERLRHE